MATLKDKINRILGNNVRLLLPSYWWKRVFGMVIDRIDDKQDTLVSGKNIKTINGKDILGEGDTNADIIINSVDELNALGLPAGSRASVVTGGPVLGSIKDCVESEIPTQWTRISGVKIDSVPVLPEGIDEIVLYFTSDGSSERKSYIIVRPTIMAAVDMSTYNTFTFSPNGKDINQSAVNKFNEYLQSGDYRLVLYEGYIEEVGDFIDSFIKFYIYHPTISEVYIKADSWERLAKESDLEDGGSGYGLVFGVERCAYVSRERVESGNITETELTDEQIAYNIETVSLLASGEKVYLSHDGTFWMKYGYDISNSKTTYYFSAVSMTLMSSNKLWGRMMAVSSDGSIDIVNTTVGGSSITVDSELSTSSTNPVQNKVITAALNNKVDKVNGKQLSTEDFTSALKTKLEGLSNYDDTSIQNAVSSLTTQINTLVSGDASAAIESFNEIIAFLNGVEDSESLDSIIAAIEQQIAAKQDKLVSGTNIKTINGVSLLGGGDITISGGGVSEDYVNTAIANAITNTLNTEV